MALIDPLAAATNGYLLNNSSFLTPITMATLGWIKIPGGIIVIPLPPVVRRKRGGGTSGGKSTSSAVAVAYRKSKKPEEETDDPRHFYDFVIRSALANINNEKVEDVQHVVRFKKSETEKTVPKPKVSKVEANKQEYIVEFKNMVHRHAELKTSGSQNIKVLPISVIVSGSFAKK